jgi:hypothetical protein
VISVLRPEAKLFGLRCLMIIGTEGDGGADPFNGALYVFRSKRADRIKAVWFDEDAQFCWAPGRPRCN